MRKAILFVAFLALSGQVWARDWFFSDCPTGCLVSGNPCNAGTAGTVGDPYCLNPDGDAKNESFAYISDGTGAEVAAGETIYLCAGACDHAGTTITDVAHDYSSWVMDDLFVADCGNSNNSKTLFIPRVSGTEANPITVRNYPGEVIAITGDLNNDNAYTQDTDADCFAVGDAARSWWIWYGSDVGTATDGTQKGLQFIKFQKVGFEMRVGAPNWTWEGIRFDKYGWWTWANADLSVPPTKGIGTVGCGGNHSVDAEDQMAIRILQNSGPTTITNSHFERTCRMAIRYINNPDPLASLVVSCNTSNDTDHFFDAWSAKNLTITGNHIDDSDVGIAADNRVENVVITDNVIRCTGRRAPSVASYFGRCDYGITVDTGTFSLGGNCPTQATINGSQRNILVARNTVWSSTDCTALCPGCTLNDCLSQSSCASACTYKYLGRMTGGMVIAPTCETGTHGSCSGAFDCTDIATTVENNFIYGQYTIFSSSTAELKKGGLDIMSNRPVTVQNNTIYRGNRGIQVNGTTVSGVTNYDVNHIVKNNTIIETNREGIVLFPTGGGTGSGINYNNVRPTASLGLPPYAQCSAITALACNAGALGNQKTCTTWPNFGVGNKCQPAVFVNPSVDPFFTDLHLAEVDTNNRNAGTAGALEDFDHDLRPVESVTDMGADEAGINFFTDSGFESGSFDPTRWNRDATCHCGGIDVRANFRSGAPFLVPFGVFAMEVPARGSCGSCPGGDVCPGVTPCGGFYRDYTGLVAFGTYRVQGYYFALEHIDSSGATLKVGIDGDTMPDNVCTLSVGAANTPGKFSCTVVLPTAAGRLRIYGTKNSFPVTLFYVDNVTMTRI